MSKHLDPSLFNIDIIAPTDADVKYLGEIVNPNIFESSTNRFDRAGLFSTDIFGQVGSQTRNTTLGYIDLKLKILHPFVFQNLCTLNSKYEDIISGKTRAKLDRDKWDLVEDKNGETGYTFFLSVLPRIRFSDNNSNERKYKIDLVRKYAKDEYMFNKFIVLPAGLRDYRVDESGQPVEDEVNTLYRRVLAVTALLKTIKIQESNLYQLDPIRYKLQKSVNAVFEHFLNLLNGKYSFIQDKWSKRSIVNGTRNVLTPVPYKITKLDKTKITTNHSVCGLYQYIKAIAPIAMNRVKSMFVNKFLSSNSSTATLVDPKTMKTSLVNIKVNKRDEWLSMEGLNRIMNKMKQSDLRFEPVEIDGYYLQLLYDNGRDIILFNDTKDIPNDLEKGFIRPITYIELFYIAIYDIKDKYPGFLTRYPVISLGGTYPCKVYVKTTFKARTVNVTINGVKKEMEEFPILGEECMESVSAASTHLAKLGADFDGDSCLGAILCRFKKSRVQKIYGRKSKGGKMPIVNKNVIYQEGLINLENFPKGDLIKVEGNKEFYKVPDNLEVLTMWNGEYEWVKPESYSIHKNLTMVSARTRSGYTIECSDDHSLVSVDENFNYVRVPPKQGLMVPRIVNAVNRFVDSKNFKYHIKSDGIVFNLNKDFGYVLGVIIGDGWVNKEHKPNDIMVATTHTGIVNKLTEVFKNYGHSGNCYSISNQHEFDGFESHSTKNTWVFKPLANICRTYIGLGAFNKQLPEFWRRTSTKFRWGLLSGLIDTDGTVGYTRNRYEIRYCTVSTNLAYGIVALANSLGLNAGLTVTQRPHKTTKEYYVFFRTKDSDVLKKNLMLFNKQKYERLSKVPQTEIDPHDKLPYITKTRLSELRDMIPKEFNTTIRLEISEALKGTFIDTYGASLRRERFIYIYETFKDKLSKDEYWNKLYKIAMNRDIMWETIATVVPIPNVTEAYDLTTPPHCTFVLQNGIVVYDTVSLNIVYTEDSIKEINELLNNPKYYLDTSGSIAYSADDDVINLVIAHMTDKPSSVDISKENSKEDVKRYLDKGYSLSTEEFGETWNYIAEAKEYTPDGYVNLKEVLNTLYRYVLPTGADFNPSKDPVGCLTRMIDGFKTMSNIPLKKEKPDNIEGLSYVDIKQLQTKTPLLGLPEDDLARKAIQVYLSMVAYWLGSRIEFTRTKEGVTETCSLDGSIPKVHDFDSWFKEEYLDKLEIKK